MFNSLCAIKNRFVCIFSGWVFSEVKNTSDRFNLHNILVQRWDFIHTHLQNVLKYQSQGLPWWHSGQESACQCRGHVFDPWSGKIPHAAEQLNPCATTTEPARHNY